MSVNLILNSYFLNLFSNHKTRPLKSDESPRFLIQMNKKIVDVIATKISELILLDMKKDL